MCSSTSQRRTTKLTHYWTILASCAIGCAQLFDKCDIFRQLWSVNLFSFTSSSRPSVQEVGGRFAISTKSPKSAFYANEPYPPCSKMRSVCDQTPSKKRCNRTLCVRKYILSTVGEDVYCWQEPKFARMQYCSCFLLCMCAGGGQLAVNHKRTNTSFHPSF